MPDLDGTRLDDEELVTLVSLVEDQRTRRDLDAAELTGQALESRAVQGREHRHRLDQRQALRRAQGYVESSHPRDGGEHHGGHGQPEDTIPHCRPTRAISRGITAAPTAIEAM